MNKIKKIIKFIWDEFIYGGHLLSLGAGAVVITALLLLNKQITWDYPFIIYLIAYTSYLYNRYKEIEKDILTNPERTYHFKKYSKYTPFIISIIFLVILSILFRFRKLFFLPFYFLLFFGGLSYTLYFKKLTKKIVAFKNIFVASEWTLPVVFLPVYYSFSFDTSLFLIVIIIYLKTFILNSYFDIKDIEMDKKEKLLTLPLLFSCKGYLKYLKYMTLCLGIFIILGVLTKHLSLFAIFLIVSIPFNLYILRQTERHKVSLSKLYLVAGSELVFWPPLLLIGKLLL